jgi:Sensors of blue-light using FAD
VGLVHCIYCSVSGSGELGEAALSARLDQCRTNNEKLDVAGMLLYQHRSFFQVLEVDRRTVAGLFEKIVADHPSPSLNVLPILARLPYSLGFRPISSTGKISFAANPYLDWVRSRLSTR